MHPELDGKQAQILASSQQFYLTMQPVTATGV